ncbi:MAG: hypothetical protein PHX52_00530 [Candidatus Pacebacteria bacterium]|nr:hypothetical protein [Candidatus Paceibacterota bacterium]MDD3919051.1 hypothetical protein [Candidatus Paceibacterota bacterium]
MNFEDIKKIVDKEGKLIILEDQNTYIISKYDAPSESKEVVVDKLEEPQEEGLKLEDLPF